MFLPVPSLAICEWVEIDHCLIKFSQQGHLGTQKQPVTSFLIAHI